MSNQHAGQVVVVTGASGGIGRATALAVRRRGAPGRPARPRRGGPGRRGRGRRAGRRHGAGDPDRRGRRRPGRRRRRPRSRTSSGPIDVWVNVAFTSVFAPFDRDHPGRVPAGHRGQLPRLRLRHHGRAATGCCPATAAPSSRSARRWPTAASRCRPPTAAPSTPSRASHESLRCELLHEQEQRAGHHGADAGGEHPAVRLGAVPAAAASRSRCRRSTSRRSPPRRRVRRRPPPAPGVLGRRLAPRRPSPPTRSPPACSTATWPAPATPPSRPTGPSRPRPPANLWEPADDAARLRRARQLRRPSTPRSAQLWASQHHGLLGGAGGLAGPLVAAALGRRGRR